MTWLSTLWRAFTPFITRSDAVIPASKPIVTIKGKASSFADPKDVAAFKRCKAQGKTDLQCFKVGDNGVGCWGDNTAQLDIPMCAVPPDDMIAKWGSVNAAKHKPIVVRVNGHQVVCRLADRMPKKKNIKNGAVIDLNPAALKALGLKPPVMVQAEWWWVE